MSSADTVAQPIERDDIETILSNLPSIPAAPASILALSSRINALEQSLSFEASSSPPLSVNLPPLNPPATPASSSSASASSSSLRKSLSPSPPPESPPSLSFLSKLSELHQSFASMEDESTSHFFSLHSAFDSLLSSSSTSSFLSSAQLKHQLLLSSYDTCMQVQSDLQELSSLLPSLTPPTLPFSSSQLSDMEAKQRLRCAEVARLHVEVDRFIVLYNDSVEALNSILVGMDRKVKQWEMQVERMERSR